MVNAQKWLENFFPKNIIKIEATSGKEKEGELRIEDYPELKEIIVDNAKSLSKLLVINCPKVEHILISGSKLSEVDISSCSNLITLYCDNNKLKKIDVSGNPQLKYFKCDKNPLEEIVGLEVNKLTNLSQLRFPDDFKIMSSLSNDKVTEAERKLGKPLDRIISNTVDILGNKNLNDIPSGKTLESLLSEVVSLQAEVAKLKATQKDLETKHNKEKEEWGKKIKMFEKINEMSEGMKLFLEIGVGKERKLKLEELIEHAPKTP